ncbi:MAG: cyclopropane-fatty-acyl-phospholipid synthase family protein [Opitutaceae bacterium]
MIRLASSDQQSVIEHAIALLDLVFEGHDSPPVSVRLWEGTLWPDGERRPATLILKSPGALRGMFGSISEKRLAEAFIADRFDVSGDLEAACSMADLLADLADSNLAKRIRLMAHLRRLPADPGEFAGRGASVSRFGRRHSRERDRQSVRFHYDLSNEFFQLWLDPRMVYSCAYFGQRDGDLERAQEAKLDLLCRKLRLKAGDRVLDVGCGWGGFAVYAARHYGVEVTGVTLSGRQADWASERVVGAGLAGRVRIEPVDYRELKPDHPFDAVVSVGMAEHVGRERLGEYFRTLRDFLRPGGVLLNHAIGEGGRPRRATCPSFIDSYVFPDGDIPPLPVVLGSAEEAGLEIRDVENLREHYGLTLRHWVRRLEAAHAQALRHVDESTYRIWRLYMAASAYAFDRGYLSVYQTLLSRPDPDGRSGLPLRRDDWYGRD